MPSNSVATHGRSTGNSSQGKWHIACATTTLRRARALCLALGAALLSLALLCAVAPRALADEPFYADLTVDRSTPEHHLRTFLSAVERCIKLLEDRELARQRDDAWLYAPSTPEEAAEIQLLKEHVLDSMDLSAFPDWRRESAGIETALMLWEIFQSEKVTADTAFKQLRDGLWVIPGTYIQAGTINAGLRMGDVVFTADTVANVPSLYQISGASQPRTGFNAYRYFTETPGGLEPPRWGAIAHKLPSALRWEFGSNTIFQWLITAVILAAVLLIPPLIGRLVRSRSLRWFCQALATGVLAKHATAVVIDQAGLSGGGATVMTLVFLALFNLSAVACILIVGEWIGSWFSRLQQAKDQSFDTSIIRLTTRVVSVMSALAVIIYGISAAGVPVYGIIAGFGVGGLAFALAAKPTLENILAGVILFLDGSLKVGDTIESSGLSGRIEDIGMRSTRIRSDDGALISVTNSELADKVIKNVSRRIRKQDNE